MPSCVPFAHLLEPNRSCLQLACFSENYGLMAAEQGELQEQLAGGLEQNGPQHGTTGPDEIGDAQAVPSLLVCVGCQNLLARCGTSASWTTTQQGANCALPALLAGLSAHNAGMCCCEACL